MSEHALTQEQIREQGLEALRKQLGVAGMVRFLQQSELGTGNYTIDRQTWLGNRDLDELALEIQAAQPERPDTI